MEKDIEILKKIKEEIEKELKSEYLINNKVPMLQEKVDKIITNKKNQIIALDNCIQRLEDLYE